MQLIPVSTTTAAYRRVYFTTVDVTDVQSRLTDAGIGAFTCKVSKNGAAAVATSNSPTEVDAGDQPGVWYLELTAAECDTLGQVIVTITAAAIEPREFVAMVVAFDPFVALPSAVWAHVLDANAPVNARTALQMLNICAAVLVGKATNQDTNAVYRDLGDTKNRVVGSVSDDDRTVSELDGT